MRTSVLTAIACCLILQGAFEQSEARDTNGERPSQRVQQILRSNGDLQVQARGARAVQPRPLGDVVARLWNEPDDPAATSNENEPGAEEACPACIIGIFDDAALTQRFGTTSGPVKTLYVGIQISPDVPPGFTGVEFSVTGLHSFDVVQWQFLNSPAVVIGSNIAAPVDTVTGSGGVSVAWSTCQPNNIAIAEITLIKLDENWPTDHEIRVVRKFPPGSRFVPAPLFTQCDVPVFTLTSVTGGVYLLNSSGPPPPPPPPPPGDDVTPPEITITLNRDVLWPPNHKLSPIQATVEVSDDQDPDPTFVLTSITSSEPDDGVTNGDKPYDIQGAEFDTPDVEFDLRSERSTQPDGRTYTATYTAMDASGNTATAAIDVRVPHDRRGRAMSATGFQADGTGILSTDDRFSLVIPSRGGDVLYNDVSLIDATRAYIGNHLAAIAPVWSMRARVDGDDLDDLILQYDTSVALALLEATWDTPIGLHYTDAAGRDFEVPDILALGEPLHLGRRAPSDERTGKSSASSAGGNSSVPSTRIVGLQPNPFNPRTTFAFELQSAQHAVVSVFDMRGAHVRTLLHRHLGGGRHEVVWDGRDAGGRAVPTGIYFFRLESGHVLETTKALLVK